MCFYIHSEHTSEKIATENIVCYKLLKVDKNDSHKIVAPFHNYFIWFNTRKKINHAMHESKLDILGNTIAAGLHTYSTLSAATAELDTTPWYYRRTNMRIYEAYIPAGATYYYNPECKEYVSDKLVICVNKLMAYKHKHKSVKTNKI